MGKNNRIVNVFLFIENKDYACRKNVDDIKMAGKKAEYGSHVEEIDEASWLISENQHHFLATCIWDVVNVIANRTRILLRNEKRCSNHEFLRSN